MYMRVYVIVFSKKIQSSSSYYYYYPWTPPLTLDTVSPEEVYVILYKLPHRPGGRRNEDGLVEFHLVLVQPLTFPIYSLVFTVSPCRSSSPLAPGHESDEARARGGEQPPKVGERPPKVGPRPTNGISGKERRGSEAGDPDEGRRRSEVAWLACVTCSQVKKEGR